MDIRLSRPCLEDPNRYLAECHLERKLVMDKVCQTLRELRAKNLRCSVRLGVARFELEGKSVMIYQSGRVDIRRIKNIDEATHIMEKLISMVKDCFQR